MARWLVRLVACVWAGRMTRDNALSNAAQVCRLEAGEEDR